MKNRTLIRQSAFAALSFISIPALLCSTANSKAQDAVYQYNYATGNLVNTYPFPTGFSNAIGVNAPTEMNGGTWADLVNSGRLWGTGHSTLVRNFDWAEDNQVNYLTTGATPGAATWYYSTNANTNAQSGTPLRTTFLGGFFDGQDILGNPNVIAVYDDQVVLYNPLAASDATSLSLYSVNTAVVTLANFGFNTFTGGPLDQQTFSSQLKNMIGAEDGYLWFLDPDGSFSTYGITTGVNVLDPTWTTFTGGMFDGMTLTDALDSGHYLGIGAGPDFYFVASVIPEPSTYVLLGTAGALAFLSRRRKSWLRLG